MGLSNYIPSSRIAQSGVCTSATRPASAYEGQIIYETDTDRVLVWNGASWIGTEKLDSVQVNSLGHLNIFSQPIISGQVGSFANPSIGLIPFDDFWVSRGITYNSTTRRFTVPTAGVYQITMNPFFLSGVAPGRVYVGVNTDSPNSTTHRGSAYRDSSSFETGSINSIISLNAGDYVVFRVHEGTLYNQTNDRFNQFSIRLVA